MVWSKYCKRFKTAFNKLTMASKSPPNKDSFSVSLSNARNQIEDLNLWNWNVTTTNYSAEMWGLYSTKCPCKTLQICNILFTYIYEFFFFVFHFMHLYLMNTLVYVHLKYYTKYNKFWSVSLQQFDFVERKPLISEEWIS